MHSPSPADRSVLQSKVTAALAPGSATPTLTTKKAVPQNRSGFRDCLLFYFQPSKEGGFLHGLVGSPGDNVQLLFFGQVDEFHGVTGYADGEVGVFRFFRMFHAVDEFFHAEHVYVQVVSALVKVTVHNPYQGFLLFGFAVAQGFS